MGCTELRRVLPAAVFGLLAYCGAGYASAAGPGLVDHKLLRSDASVSGARLTNATCVWQFGDRRMPLSGLCLNGREAWVQFELQTRATALLTLELREFRTEDGQSPAYTVSINGRPVAFRCRHYDGAGPASAFIDIPQTARAGRIRVRVTNVADTPLCLSQALLWSDIEAYARDNGLLRPMYLGPTVGGRPDAQRLRQVRELLPETEDYRPMVVLAVFAVAQWPPERIHERLTETLRACADANTPVELHLNTWWAGTPSGCDGRGGQWYDPAYQQVTYDPDTGRFGLSVPNCWSSVPWLTTASRTLNAYKQRQFTAVGRIVRDAADAWETQHADKPSPFPVRSLVIDNEVAYWGAGNPDTPPRLQADFNPAVVAAARDQGIALDPRDGVSSAEMEFLRDNLRVYNRQMADALLEGLGACRCRENIYTHTFMRGWCFDNDLQATEVGVLNGVKMGAEWGEAGGGAAEQLSLLDVHRELGIPANINCELGGDHDATTQVELAYAAGSDHISLFNLSDEGVKRTTQGLSLGHHSFPPVPWRRRVFSEDFETEGWRERFDCEDVSWSMIWPGPMHAIFASEPGSAGRARLRITARDAVGRDTFHRLSMRYWARAFVHRQQSDDAWLIIRAGHSPDQMQQVQRLTNASGRFTTDITDVVQGAKEAFIEFEFHPLGLAGWVCLFDLALEVPWQEENLLLCNRSYSAKRLRAESAIVASRAEATWGLIECARTGAISEDELAALRRRIVAGDAQAVALRARRLLLQAQRDTHTPWQPPNPDREEEGQARGTAPDALIFDPYDSGFMQRRVPLHADARIDLAENGQVRALDNARQIVFGDDLRLVIRGGKAIQVTARRGTATGTVMLMQPATAFKLPLLKISGVPAMRLSSLTTPSGRGPKHKPASCPVRVGDRPFQRGDHVRIRWNPRTRRIVQAELIEPGK